MGIIGTGLLAIPVLAGSTAYALAEGRKLPVGLARNPKQAIALAAANTAGVMIDSSLWTRSRLSIERCDQRHRRRALYGRRHDPCTAQGSDGPFCGSRVAAYDRGDDVVHHRHDCEYSSWLS